MFCSNSSINLFVWLPPKQSINKGLVDFFLSLINSGIILSSIPGNWNNIKIAIASIFLDFKQIFVQSINFLVSASPLRSKGLEIAE